MKFVKPKGEYTEGFVKRCEEYYHKIVQRIGVSGMSLNDICFELSDEFPYYEPDTIRMYYYYGAHFCLKGQQKSLF